ncbi:hypothetical protein JHK87_016149 [Glycine soja]|nr:hypothetical protein JHK87_016149 [Glycine soja]
MASPPLLPDATDNPPEVTPKKTRQSTRLRSLTTRSLDQPRPIVSVDPTTRRESGPHKDNFHSYLGVVAREKIPIVHATWNDDSQKPPPKPIEQPVKGTGVAKDNALVELVKKLYVVYQKPIELSWDGAKFGLPNAKNGFFITHADVTEIILGNTFLNISILQLWMMFMNDCSTSIGLAPIYGFLEPHAIHYAKDKRKECEQYITNCVKESHREVYLGPYLNQ